MTAIADSSAVLDRERVLVQHQAALTLLQARLSEPQGPPLSWLDLACGRGQIITSLEENLSPAARARVHFYGYDINDGYAREALRHARTLSLASYMFTVGALSAFDTVLPTEARFDFITLINTTHELPPAELPTLLISAIRRLSDTGTLFIYDMERLTPLELGAIPWTRDEVRKIVGIMLDSLGVTANYRPEVGKWLHKSCEAWNVQIQRQYLGLSNDQILDKEALAALATERLVADLLEQRSQICVHSLETLTACGAETPEEEAEQERLLYEFWALSRAKGARR